MVALGCVFLIVFPLIGLSLGLWLGGAAAGLWGAAIGFALALAISGVTTYALVKASRR